MDNILFSNFLLMRFNVLNTTLGGMGNSPFDPAYLFAWQSGVYPAGHASALWHRPFGECFFVSSEKMDELSKVLDDHWIEKKPITFYELEKHFGVHDAHRSSTEWSRAKLTSGCRYLFLEDAFDLEFWATLTENGKCPSEAHSITRKFDDSNIYFS